MRIICGVIWNDTSHHIRSASPRHHVYVCVCVCFFSNDESPRSILQHTSTPYTQITSNGMYEGAYCESFHLENAYSQCLKPHNSQPRPEQTNNGRVALMIVGWWFRRAFRWCGCLCVPNRFTQRGNETSFVCSVVRILHQSYYFMDGAIL